jgi:hypothetical protein
MAGNKALRQIINIAAYDIGHLPNCHGLWQLVR